MYISISHVSHVSHVRLSIDGDSFLESQRPIETKNTLTNPHPGAEDLVPGRKRKKLAPSWPLEVAKSSPSSHILNIYIYIPYLSFWKFCYLSTS